MIDLSIDKEQDGVETRLPIAELVAYPAVLHLQPRAPQLKYHQVLSQLLPDKLLWYPARVPLQPLERLPGMMADVVPPLAMPCVMHPVLMAAAAREYLSDAREHRNRPSLMLTYID